MNKTSIVERGNHSPQKFQRRIQEVAHMFRNIADTVGILETSWTTRYTVKDMETLQHLIQEATSEATMRFANAINDLPTEQSGQIRRTHKSYSLD